MKSNNLTIIKHPLVQHKLALLRNKDTDHLAFRQLTKELTMFMMYEVMKDCPLQDVEVQTPLALTRAKILAREITVVLILRAGLGMMDGMLELVPKARVGHIGLYRNEETLEPVEYYAKFPKNIAETDVIVVDPMLATGGSAAKAIEIVKGTGAKHIKFVCIVSAPQGVKTLHAAHPKIGIFTGSLDAELNDQGYIVPGLGDAGDRLFGTK
jgi:uracil phosphoribosyltransferase